VDAAAIRLCGYQEFRRNSDHNFGAKSRYHHILQQLRFVLMSDFSAMPITILARNQPAPGWTLKLSGFEVTKNSVGIVITILVQKVDITIFYSNLGLF
jgi:hypothetical protein